jgi:hypothetical protein
MAYRMAADYNVQGGHFGAPGLHGCAGGCGCEGNCGMTGMGLFENPTDLSTWGIAEWAIVFGGIYLGLSLIGDTKRGIERTRSAGKAFAGAGSSKARKRARL